MALLSVPIFAAGFLVFLPTLRFEFLTSWDDPTYVVDNPWIRGFTRENLTFAFTKPYFANFLPLHLVSYMLDYSLWGLKPFGYHLQSVLLHALNGVLAFVLVRQLFGSLALALLGSLLFAVHPSHVEAVAWVSIRKDLLSTLFLLLTVILYDRAVPGRRVRPVLYVASIAAFTLGLLSKVSIAAIPAFLLLLDWLKPRGAARPSWRTVLATKIPYGILALWLVHLNSLAQVKAKAAYAQEPVRYLMVKGHAVWNYLSLLTAVPTGRPIYDTPELPLEAARVTLELAGLVLLPAVFALAVRRGLRPLALGSAWIFILLLPALLFPLVTYMADRYLYAPSLGFCWIVAAGVVALSRRVAPGGARAAAAALLAAVPLVLFTVRTLQYVPVWRSSETLWTHAVTKSRDFRARNNLAQVRLDQKRWKEAEELYRTALGVENVTSYQGLAVLYYNQQRYDEAQRMIEKAFEIAAVKQDVDHSDLAELYYTRGAIHWVRGERERAIASWEEALRVVPRHARAREWLQTARGG